MLVLFFFVDAHVMRSRTVTGVKAYWVEPCANRNLQGKEIASTDFTAPKTLKRKLESKYHGSTQ